MLSLEQFMIAAERVDIDLSRSHRWRRGHGIATKVSIDVGIHVTVVRRQIRCLIAARGHFGPVWGITLDVLGEQV